MSAPAPPFAWIVFYSSDGANVYFSKALINNKIGPFAVPRARGQPEHRMLPAYLTSTFGLNSEGYQPPRPAGSWNGSAVYAVILNKEISSDFVHKVNRATQYQKIPASDLIDEKTFQSVVALTDAVAPSGHALQQGLPPSLSSSSSSSSSKTQFKLDPGYTKLGNIAVVILDLNRQQIVLQLENQDRNYGIPVVKNVTANDTPVEIIRRALGLDPQADVSMLNPEVLEVVKSDIANYPETNMAYVYGYNSFPDYVLSPKNKQKLYPYWLVTDPAELAKTNRTFPNAVITELLANAMIAHYDWQTTASSAGSSGTGSGASSAGTTSGKVAGPSSPSKLVAYVPSVSGDAFRYDLNQDRRSRLVLNINDLWSMRTVDGVDIHVEKTNEPREFAQLLFDELSQALWHESIRGTLSGGWQDKLNVALYRLAYGWPTNVEPTDMTAVAQAHLPQEISSGVMRSNSLPTVDVMQRLGRQLWGQYALRSATGGETIIADLRQLTIMKHMGQYDEISIDRQDNEPLARYMTQLAMKLGVNINVFYSLESDGPGIHSVQFQLSGEDPIHSRLRTCADAMILRGQSVSVYLVEVDKSTVFVGRFHHQ